MRIKDERLSISTLIEADEFPAESQNPSFHRACQPKCGTMQTVGGLIRRSTMSWSDGCLSRHRSIPISLSHGISTLGHSVPGPSTRPQWKAPWPPVSGMNVFSTTPRRFSFSSMAIANEFGAVVSSHLSARGIRRLHVPLQRNAAVSPTVARRDIPQRSIFGTILVCILAYPIWRSVGRRLGGNCGRVSRRGD